MGAIDCAFAIIDVKRGRKSLRKRLLRGDTVRVSVVGTIYSDLSSIGHDDGTSIEFQMRVESCTEIPDGDVG